MHAHAIYIDGQKASRCSRHGVGEREARDLRAFWRAMIGGREGAFDEGEGGRHEPVPTRGRRGSYRGEGGREGGRGEGGREGGRGEGGREGGRGEGGREGHRGEGGREGGRGDGGGAGRRGGGPYRGEGGAGFGAGGGHRGGSSSRHGYGWPSDPFGGGPRGPFGRRRKARRGDIRVAALLLLVEAPRNGYQIMQEIEQRSEGAWRPSPGSVYPALQQLEDEGLIRLANDGDRKLYELTHAGRDEVDKRDEDAPAPWEQMTAGVGGSAAELGGIAREVAFAFAQVMRAGSEVQLQAAKKVLTQTRRDLYRLLADGDGGDARQDAGEDSPQSPDVERPRDDGAGDQ